jgi:hypothetical protein
MQIRTLVEKLRVAYLPKYFSSVSTTQNIILKNKKVLLERSVNLRIYWPDFESKTRRM